MHTHIVASYPLFCKLIVFKTMLPTRAGSTFSIFSPFHVGANARCSCLGRYMGLSVRALIATWAFQNSHSGSWTIIVHKSRARVRILKGPCSDQSTKREAHVATKTRTCCICIDMERAEIRKCASRSSGEHGFENGDFAKKWI